MPGADGHLWDYMESHGRQRVVNGLGGDPRDADGLWRLCHNFEGSLWMNRRKGVSARGPVLPPA